MRKYLPTLGDLIDRLSITQLKEVFIPEHKQEYAAEIQDIVHDISIILSGIWIVVIWVATGVVDRFLIHFNIVWRFFLYLVFVTAITLPLEMFFINAGFRIYGPSATANFSGFATPLSHIPIEVAFAIPLYLSLVIAFIRYIEIILDNKNL